MLTIDYHGYAVREDAAVTQKRAPGTPLRGHAVGGGYRRVTLSTPTGRRHVLVHILVAELFIGPKPPGMEVNHRDGSKTNNAASNLEYVTPTANVRHSIDVLHTERAPGEKNANAKLTDALVRQIRKDYDDGTPVAAIAADLDIHHSTAHRVATRRTWRHVA